MSRLFGALIGTGRSAVLGISHGLALHFKALCKIASSDVGVSCIRKSPWSLLCCFVLFLGLWLFRAFLRLFSIGAAEALTSNVLLKISALFVLVVLRICAPYVSHAVFFDGLHLFDQQLCADLREQPVVHGAWSQLVGLLKTLVLLAVLLPLTAFALLSWLPVITLAWPLLLLAGLAVLLVLLCASSSVGAVLVTALGVPSPVLVVMGCAGVVCGLVLGDFVGWVSYLLKVP
jgi:hypothetical protein